MKKVIIILLFVAGVAVAYGIGYLNALWENDREHAVADKLKKEFALRVEAYQPSCEELRHKGLPVIRKKGNDYFLVLTTSDYYHVIGINHSTDKAPITYWWGAGLEHAVKECRDSSVK